MALESDLRAIGRHGGVVVPRVPGPMVGRQILGARAVDIRSDDVLEGGDVAERNDDNTTGRRGSAQPAWQADEKCSYNGYKEGTEQTPRSHCALSVALPTRHHNEFEQGQAVESGEGTS